MRSRINVIRFRLEETSEYIVSTTDHTQIEQMEQKKAFRVDNVVFTVPKDKGSFTIILEIDAPRVFPWQFKDLPALSPP